MGREDVSSPSRTRRRQPLSTQRGLAVAKTTVLLIVDGNTERDYFKRIDELGIFPNLRFKPVIGDDSSFKNIFKENYDIFNKYLILDIDHSKVHNTKRESRIRSILSKKETKNVVYFNNYSFETFLLNHITVFGAPITDKGQYDEYMKRYFGVNSWSNNKHKQNTSIVIGKIDEESFRKMMNNIRGIVKEDCFDNPSSNMNLLFEELEKIK